MFVRAIVFTFILISLPTRAEQTAPAEEPPKITSAVEPQLMNTAEGIRESVERSGAPALPRLGPRHSDDNPFAEWQRRLNEWIEKLFKRFMPGPGATKATIETLKYVGWIMMLAIAILAAWAIYRWLRRQQETQMKYHAPRHFAKDAGHTLLSEYRESLGRGDYARAARIRWRLFQVRLSRPAGETQTDLNQISQQAGAPAPDLGLSPAAANELMFGTTGAQETSSERWQQGLAQVESQGLSPLLDHPRKDQSGRMTEGAILFTLTFIMIAALLLGFLREGSTQRELAVAQGDGPFQIRGVLEQRPEQPTVLNLPLLEANEIPTDKDGRNITLMLSPRMSLSGREAKILTERIEAGGQLIISYHDEASRKAVAQTLMRLMVDILPEGTLDESFRNMKVKVTEAPNDLEQFRKGEKYAFYSPYKMQDMLCTLEEFFCYIREIPLGYGRVTVISGVFPGAASLVLEADNRFFAARLAQDIRPLILDQYHLLQSDRGIWDLFFEPFFVIPMLILIAGLIIYMIWGAESVARRRGPHILRADRPNYLKRSPYQAESYHQFSRRVVRQALKRPAAFEEARTLQDGWFAQLMAFRRGGAPQLRDVDIRQLTQDHIDWLKENFLWKSSRKDPHHDDKTSV